MTTQESMGLRIKGLRESKKMSQAELAEKVGYKDKTAIAKVEAGKVDLPQSKISSFVKVLGTTTSYLFADEEIEKPTAMAAHFDGDEYTEDELDRIKEFAAFVKSSRK
jgi:transcriptional regulator with XRE-family HTH domain